MSKLKTPIELETTFGTYQLDEVLGEGGSGRVYGGFDSDHVSVAVKVLSPNVSSDKRKRFKNELSFHLGNRHSNIVTALDHGVMRNGQIDGPFYVMPRYDSSLRGLMASRIKPSDALPYFSQILDGVEAAHLLGNVHRDLKPENILFDRKTNTLAVADFGAARFVEDQMVTSVETGPTQRLANFQYAAPEQRILNGIVEQPADIWALGMMLNEMFTGNVPHGTDYRTISDAAPDFGFLDEVVRQAIRQSPKERQLSISEIKSQIRKYEFDAVTQQKLDALKNRVVNAEQIDDDLAITPPRLIDAFWNNEQLVLKLDKPVNQGWIQAFYNMGSYRSVMGAEPGRFVFTGAQAQISIRGEQAQSVIDYFKPWLPQASAIYKHHLEAAEAERQRQLRDQVRRQREAEEQNLRVNQSLRI